MSASDARQQAAKDLPSTTLSSAGATSKARGIGGLPAPGTSARRGSVSSDASARALLGVRFSIGNGGGKLPTVGDRRAWSRLGEQLLDSCRNGDTWSRDQDSLTIMFACADPGSALTARERVLESATKCWGRAGAGNVLEVEDVHGDPKSYKQPLPRPVAEFLRRPPPAIRSSLKRATDIVGALVGVVVLSPVLGLVALGIRLVSDGPVLFRQQRVGVGGVPFTMLKFRTMEHGANESAHRDHMRAYIAGELGPSSEDGSVKLTGDQRVFPFGAFLRRWSLDELPQLFNVLGGDHEPRRTSSLRALRVGSTIEEWHRERLAVKPGITGLWQVCGRGRTPFDHMTRMDIRYIRTWSVWEDVKLLFRTFPATLSRAGAG